MTETEFDSVIGLSDEELKLEIHRTETRLRWLKSELTGRACAEGMKEFRLLCQTGDPDWTSPKGTVRNEDLPII